MPVITRNKARSRQPLAPVASPRASLPRRVSSSSSELPQKPSLQGGVNCSNRTSGSRPSTMAVGNMRPTASHNCRADCWTCPTLIFKKDFTSTITGRTYYAIDINSHEVHCKLHNYIYLLTCTVRW